MPKNVGYYKEDAPKGWMETEAKKYGSDNSPTQGKKIGSSVTGNGVKGTEKKY